MKLPSYSHSLLHHGLLKGKGVLHVVFVTKNKMCLQYFTSYGQENISINILLTYRTSFLKHSFLKSLKSL